MDSISRYTVVVVSLASLLALAGCNETGACMIKFTGQQEETCNEVKRSVCLEGKDRFIGGKCPTEKKGTSGK